MSSARAFHPCRRTLCFYTQSVNNAVNTIHSVMISFHQVYIPYKSYDYHIIIHYGTQ